MSKKKKSGEALIIECEPIESAESTDKSDKNAVEDIPISESDSASGDIHDEAPQESPELIYEAKSEETADNEPSHNDSEIEEANKSIEELTAEIKRLKEQIEKLEELKRCQNRILAEIGDFVALFPEIPIEEIPDTVWESVKQGAPLAASYALYEKRMVAEAKRIAEINAKNAKKSPGAAGKDTAGEYFSPEDVRRMSRAEVHANYSKIKDSMKKWM